MSKGGSKFHKQRSQQKWEEAFVLEGGMFMLKAEDEHVRTHKKTYKQGYYSKQK